jgi:hypothetical protein
MKREKWTEAIHFQRLILETTGQDWRQIMKKGLTLSAMAAVLVTGMGVPLTAADAGQRYKYREWQGRDGRTYCRKRDGTVGIVVGGVAGALVGRAVDTRGDRATGTILGAGAGALLGREIARKRSCR